MKKIVFLLVLISSLFLTSCTKEITYADVAATTLPVYEFTARLCQNTPIMVTRLVTEAVSCLHDYSLNVNQVRSAEAAKVIIISGAGLEASFLGDLITDMDIIDASEGIQLICPEEENEHHDHDDVHDNHSHGHHHEQDPHIWLNPDNAAIMARNICDNLVMRYPEHRSTFEDNLAELQYDISSLSEYGHDTLNQLSCREIITFHDGFSYFAEAYDLTILEAVEEESGSEASAQELIHLIEEVKHHNLPAIFTEKNGSDSAASIIARETNIGCFSLDMAMSGDSYFEAMYSNINTVKEALQ